MSVRVQESPRLRVVIAAVEVVEPCLGIIVISPVEERVRLAYGVGQRTGCAERFSPRVIAVLYDVLQLLPTIPVTSPCESAV